MNDDPLSFAISTVMNYNTPVGKLLRDMTTNNVPDMSMLIRNVHASIADSNTSRCNVYKIINPTFKVHDVYNRKHAINDLQRISFTRFRVSGHSLAVETGRWNRRGRGRLPLEERLCVCGSVQTEKHVVEDCPNTQHFRDFYGIHTLNDLFLVLRMMWYARLFMIFYGYMFKCSCSFYLHSFYLKNKVFIKSNWLDYSYLMF